MLPIGGSTHTIATPSSFHKTMRHTFTYRAQILESSVVNDIDMILWFLSSEKIVTFRKPLKIQQVDVYVPKLGRYGAFAQKLADSNVGVTDYNGPIVPQHTTKYTQFSRV